MTTKTDSATAAGSRTESFKQQVAVLKIKEPNASRDTPLMYAGAALMVIGIVVSVIGYFMSHGTSNSLTQNDAVTIAIIGIPITVAGAALFLRYSMASFLR